MRCCEDPLREAVAMISTTTATTIMTKTGKPITAAPNLWCPLKHTIAGCDGLVHYKRVGF
jgi:hypothetical protein